MTCWEREKEHYLIYNDKRRQQYKAIKSRIEQASIEDEGFTLGERNRKSEQGRMGDALALGGEEGRDKLR